MSFSDFLSLTRIPVAVFFAYGLMKGEILISLFLFLLGSFSDLLDGLLSRRFKKSKYGYILDPVADRTFIGISLISLYYVPLENDINLFLLLMVVGQDLLLSPIGLYLSLSSIKKEKVIRSSPVGKIAPLFSTSL
ncbi:MAG: CDP-alcohol phosphatidyltransferase family protein [Aquificaceae bacterium]